MVGWTRVVRSETYANRPRVIQELARGVLTGTLSVDGVPEGRAAVRGNTEAWLPCVGLLGRVRVCRRYLFRRTPVLEPLMRSNLYAIRCEPTHVDHGKSENGQCSRRPASLSGIPLQIFCETCGVGHFNASTCSNWDMGLGSWTHAKSCWLDTIQTARRHRSSLTW
jgi:hypothetical protein